MPNVCLALCVDGGGNGEKRRLCIEHTIKLHAAAGHRIISHDCHYGGWAWDVVDTVLRYLSAASDGMCSQPLSSTDY